MAQLAYNSRNCRSRTSVQVCEPRGVQREQGTALAPDGNLVTGAADAYDGTGRAEEGTGVAADEECSHGVLRALAGAGSRGEADEGQGAEGGTAAD